jgi:hypothetical protein
MQKAFEEQILNSEDDDLDQSNTNHAKDIDLEKLDFEEINHTQSNDTKDNNRGKSELSFEN